MGGGVIFFFFFHMPKKWGGGFFLYKILAAQGLLQACCLLKQSIHIFITAELVYKAVWFDGTQEGNDKFLYTSGFSC